MEQLAGLKDARERLAYVVECGRQQPPLEAALKAESTRVEGCLAQLWLVASFANGKCYFRTDSESAVMKGVAALLCDFYSDQSPAEIVETDPTFLKQSGITQHLTPNRRNGLTRIWETIREFAAARLAETGGVTG